MTDERTPDAQSKDQLREFRKVVAAAVGELRSSQVRNTYAALSLEELMDQHVSRLVDTNDPIHLSRKQRIDRVHQGLTNSITAMKATDPSAFRARDPATDTNTNPDGSDADPVPGTTVGGVPAPASSPTQPLGTGAT